MDRAPARAPEPLELRGRRACGVALAERGRERLADLRRVRRVVRGDEETSVVGKDAPRLALEPRTGRTGARVPRLRPPGGEVDVELKDCAVLEADAQRDLRGDREHADVREAARDRRRRERLDASRVALDADVVLRPPRRRAVEKERVLPEPDLDDERRPPSEHARPLAGARELAPRSDDERAVRDRGAAAGGAVAHAGANLADGR